MSAADLWACFGGTELWNKSQLSQMINAGLGPQGIICEDCTVFPALDCGLGFPTGYNQTDLPWYDPAEPDSLEFAGFFVTSYNVEPGNFTRPVIEKAGVGAVVGQGRNNAPQIVITGLLFAATCCGMEFGYRWMRKALRGSCAPNTACAGDDFTFLSCDPVFPDDDLTTPNCETYLSQYFRTFKGAALVDGPKITQIVARGCPTCYDCGIYEIQFTLSASDPCIYREPVEILSATPFDCSASVGGCIEWIVDADGTADCSDCPPEAPCATDPNCTDVSPPAMPSIVNPCVDDCIGDTDCSVFLDVPDGTFPATAEGTLIVTIFAGSLPLTGIEIKVWENPLNLTPDQLDDCGVCSTLAISYVAAGATLVIDGAGRTSTIECLGGAQVRANPFIASGNGSANFSYPAFLCGSDYTVGVSAHAPIAADATVTIQAVAREC